MLKFNFFIQLRYVKTKSEISFKILKKYKIDFMLKTVLHKNLRGSFGKSA